MALITQSWYLTHLSTGQKHDTDFCGCQKSKMSAGCSFLKTPGYRCPCLFQVWEVSHTPWLVGPLLQVEASKGGGGSSSCQVTWLCHPLLHVRTFVITLGYLGQPACSPYFTVNRWADLLQSATLISRCHITYHRLWRLWHARFRAEKVSYHIKVLMSKRVIVRLVRRWGMKARTFT